MKQIEILTKQHSDIEKIIREIEGLKNDSIKENATQIAMKINQLAGILKIHLNSEDKYMYPNLIENTNHKISQTASLFVEEMGNLNSIFEDYKVKYNTMSKIISDMESFKENTKNVMAALLGRLKKEEKELYILL
ncbi:hemerythrin HHE cation binding domain-containing protein [Natranaerovirga pectinivora]|uniref:Hemerythrin HHE cation binding domain-containing protein n=1 Tax=Natranaerovirga pectinivora TaxID=682400 RepID=A0A4R3MEP1_9FIRM|nr:hemerythrin domain-containing protein [Natranaerovirga pectinivora]TCT12120.1 hemerythrin HHE cation binding domain-containing protein [Natranaerovirga pectinivora]